MNAVKEYFDILKKCALFRNIEESDLGPMLHCLDAKIRKVSKNQPVFLEGEPAESVGIVLKGMAQIVKEDYYGNRSIVMGMEPSQLFGEAFACAGLETMPVSIYAACDSVFLLVDCKRILNLCSNACTFHNRLVRNLLCVVAGKNLMLNQKMEVLSKKTTREKLMTYLLAQAKRQGNAAFTIPYDRQGLADYLGVERSAMSAELGRMQKDGLLEYKKNYFKLSENY